jgi:hypothetical protein
VIEDVVQIPPELNTEAWELSHHDIHDDDVFFSAILILDAN